MSPIDPNRASPDRALSEEAEALDYKPLAALVPILRAIRAHPGVVVGLTLLTVLAAAALLSQRSTVYEARAQILVTPLVERQTAYVGLPIVRTSPGDPTRTVATSAGVVSSPDVAERAAAQIEGLSGPQVRENVVVEPLEDTNIIDIEATSGRPELAAQIASEYARAVLAERRESLRPMVRAEIRQTEEQLENLSDQTGTAASELRTKLSELRTIRDGTDPTLSIAQFADVPSSPSGRPAWLLLLVALGGGLLVGTGTAVLMRLVTPQRVEEDELLQEILPMPVLARVPGYQRGESSRGLRPPRASRDAFRLLQAQLELSSVAAAGGGLATAEGELIAMLGVSQGDGVTTSTLGLASAIAEAGDPVIVVDLALDDGLAPILGAEPRRRLTTSGEPPELGELLTDVPGHPRVRLIAAEAQVGMSRLRETLEDARRYCRAVIVDCGSVETIRAALGVIPRADHLVLVARLGHSRTDSLALARELIEQRAARDRAGYLLLDTAGLRGHGGSAA